MSILFFFLAGISTILLFVGLIRPKTFNSFFKGKATRRKVGLRFGLVTFALFVLFTIFVVRESPDVAPVVQNQQSNAATNDTTVPNNTVEPEEKSQENNEDPKEPAPEPESSPDIQVEVLKHEYNGDLERWINAALLVESQDQELLKQVAFNYRKEKCDIQCNIEIWDDREAFNAQAEVDQLISEWRFDESDVVKCETEVFRKDHLVGSTTLFAPDDWAPYPIKEADGQLDPLCDKYR